METVDLQIIVVLVTIIGSTIAAIVILGTFMHLTAQRLDADRRQTNDRADADRRAIAEQADKDRREARDRLEVALGKIDLAVQDVRSARLVHLP